MTKTLMSRVGFTNTTRAAMRKANNQAGLAIPAAILAIAIISVMALTGLYLARNDAHANIGTGNSLKALYAADAGVNRTLMGWNPFDALALNPGDSIVIPWRTLPNGAMYRGSILRTDAGLTDTSYYRVMTVGRPGQGLTAQRAVFMTLRSSRVSEVCCESAVKVKGKLRINGGGSRVKISGIDTDPPGWGGNCSGIRSDLPGVTVLDTDSLRITGKPDIFGAPPILEDPTITDDDFLQFGDATYEDLVKAADIRLDGDQTISSIAPELTADGDCDVSVVTNWGDPLDTGGACFGHMPIVHVSGDLHLSGSGIGQGLLLVDGDLITTGGFEYAGMILVQGEADVRGTATIMGGVVARNGLSASDESAIAGNSNITYSSCVSEKLATAASLTRPTVGRHWFQVTE